MAVPGFKGRTINAAVEGVRNAFVDDELAMAVQEAIDELSIHLYTVVDKLVDDRSEKFDRSAAFSSECNDRRLDENDELDAIALPFIGYNIYMC